MHTDPDFNRLLQYFVKYLKMWIEDPTGDTTYTIDIGQ